MNWFQIIILTAVFGFMAIVAISVLFEAYFKARSKYTKEQLSINVCLDGKNIAKALIPFIRKGDASLG